MRFLQNINISKKILIIIMFSAIALILIGLFGMYGMKEMASNSQKMYEEKLLPNTYIAKIENYRRTNDSYIIELMITEDEKRNQELLEAIKKNMEESNKYIKKLDAIKLSQEETNAYKIFKDVYDGFEQLQDQVISLALNNFNDSAYNLYTKNLRSKTNVINSQLDELQETNQAEAERISKENESYYSTMILVTAGIIIVSVALAVLFGLYISSMIVAPIKRLKALMEKGGQGDFSERYAYIGKDEVGSLSDSYNTMADGMKGLIEMLSETSHHLASSSEQLSSSSEESSKASEHISETIQELAVGSETQMRLMESSSEGIRNVNETTGSITERAKKVAETAEQTSDVSAEGAKRISEVTTQMKSINNNVASLAQSIATLESRINEIGDITKVITDISSQTNLLALNAAIEAARAGEQGKGFAVVADEVRKLAEQTAGSAEQITNLISQIQTDSKNTSLSMTTAANDVDAGINIVQDAGEAFKKIEGSVNELVILVEEVSESLNQLKEHTNTINGSILEVNSMASEAAASTENVSAATEEQVASMQEIAASSTSLAQLASDLQDKIKQFKI
ncbi:methyl-accepting chemotaxis protein [Cytobacillus oceanisediminis]|uniref:methyl-accepting chemotaxis protein n=1 Tax=Bacillaceae TaxID=186817 RepID=UPI001CCB2524|nr:MULTISPECIES: methyl-accepting chemotaxis protein [Bacillaceae]MBQ6447162.1 methyl-accepting chemotaxis protein [Bacillus sp. (in: firmicutes)]MBZ9533448.1 methyl-accepting chemotaxis protein [Cytobacillus oceanisediminis]UTI41627.1 methyl-accepting chemotaxis protein [Niallia sp. RD1]